MPHRVIVIGGGPAGMMAAIAAAESGASVTLLEGNEKIGKKLYITGKGRCNLTNACDREEFLRNIPRNGRFLLSSLSKMDSRALMRRVEDMGVPLVIERGNRVFPRSGKASDVTRALQRAMEQTGVTTRVGGRCQGLSVRDGVLCGVRAQGGDLPCEAAIIATGGLSYPLTGSTGDGYRFAREAGHDVTPCTPSLVPLIVNDRWVRSLQGLSLKNVELCAAEGQKTVFRERGEMLFTHFGISGPLVLTLSAHLPQEAREWSVFLDLKPALTPEQVEARLLREIEGAGRKQLSTVLGAMLPRSLADLFPEMAGVGAQEQAGQATRQQRLSLAALIKRLPLAVEGARPIEEAVVTRGGVSVRQVDPKTMQSKLVKGLYFAGEVLDVDGYTGGFNMQIAFSTGFAAGLAAAQEREGS